jgi:hypothetical protein
MLTGINAHDSTDLDNAPLTASRPQWSISMIKDIIVRLEHRIARDPARDFAIAIAETFDTHIVGIAFAYAPHMRRIFRATRCWRCHLILWPRC